MMSDHPKILRCPVCLGALDNSPDGLDCRTCNRNYPIRDEITDVRVGYHDYNFDPALREKMKNLMANVTAETWVSSIRRFIESTKNDVSWLDELIVDGRYGWKIFLDIDKQSVIMDIGCGLGNLASNLAPQAKKTIAMDLTHESLEFSKKRFEIFNPDDDIELIAGGDAARLPFEDKTFDCITVSGVLEWVGEGDMAPFQTGSKPARFWRMVAYQFGRHGPRSIQLQFLKEIRRVLKDDGQLFIGTNNRFNLEHLFDPPDDPSGLKRGSLLPRVLANLYSLWRRQSPYRAYTYSMSGYRRLLKQAGFAKIEFLSLFKGYSELNEIVPSDAEVSQWRGAPLGPRSRAQRIKRYKSFVPAFGIVANVNGGKRQSLYDRVLAAVASNAGLGAISAYSIDAVRISAKEKLLMWGSAGDTQFMIKVPFSAAAIGSEQTNHEILAKLTNNENHPDFLPQAIAEGKVDGFQYFVEQRMSGAEISSVASSWDKAQTLQLAADTLSAISSLAPLSHKTLEGDLYEHFVTAKIGEISKQLDDPELISGLKAHFQDVLYGIPVSVGIQHGDFSLSNILVDGVQVSGLIDWEAGAIEGLPILDAINFTMSQNLTRHPASTPAVSWMQVASLLDDDSEETTFLQRAYQAHGMDMVHHRAMVHLHWLHVVAFRLKFGMGCNPVEIGKFVYDVANKLPPSSQEAFKLAL